MEEALHSTIGGGTIQSECLSHSKAVRKGRNVSVINAFGDMEVEGGIHRECSMQSLLSACHNQAT
jgi:hypothetical protein